MLPANIAAARSFISLVVAGERPSLSHLARSLDELALAYHNTPAGVPDENAPEPPPSQLHAAELAKRFSELGFYAVADPTEALPGEATTGDAIDDLLDIAGDLQGVLWRFENVGANDAHWHFRFLFEAHWGRHLRELSLYLHATQFGSRPPRLESERTNP